MIDPLAEDMRQIDQQLGGHFTTIKNKLKLRLPLVGDKWGQDVLLKTIKGAETSILVGLLSALLAVVIGTFWVQLQVILAVGWMMYRTGSIIFLLRFLICYWYCYCGSTPTERNSVDCPDFRFNRLDWGYFVWFIEYMKVKSREYVLAAKAIGVSHLRRMFVHIFPNVSHIAFGSNFDLVVSFIKSEVILSFPRFWCACWCGVLGQYVE